jgi:hypothetical protein
MRGVAAALVLTVIGVATPSAAQEIVLTGPLAGACPAILKRYHVPAKLEASEWIGTGVSDGRQAGADHVSAFFRAGAELTAGVLSYPGFPAPRRDRIGPEPPPWVWNRAELRLGPWAAAETRSAGWLVEGGITALLGTTDDYLNWLFFTAPWGMFDLRVGGGYGAFPDGRSPHLAAALGWGYRYVSARQTWGGACDPPPPAAPLAEATLLRFVATVRRATGLPATEVVFAIELSPSWVLAPSQVGARRRRD